MITLLAGLSSVVQGDNRVIRKIVCIWMPFPRSFTCQILPSDRPIKFRRREERRNGIIEETVGSRNVCLCAGDVLRRQRPGKRFEPESDDAAKTPPQHQRL